MGVGPSGYRYDVFLSYSRIQQWPRWVDAHFLPIVSHWLSAELGRDVSIFQDVRGVEVGQRWTEELECGLAASRIMISLWSKSYFRSDWCVRELGSALARADRMRSLGLSGRVVFPVAVHDSDPTDLPEPARALQYERIQEYSDPFTHPHSPLRESLSRTLQVMCKQAAREISTLPDDTFAWPMADCGGYVRRLRVDPTAQLSRPTLGVSA